MCPPTRTGVRSLFRVSTLTGIMTGSMQKEARSFHFDVQAESRARRIAGFRTVTERGVRLLPFGRCRPIALCLGLSLKLPAGNMLYSTTPPMIAAACFCQNCSLAGLQKKKNQIFSRVMPCLAGQVLDSRGWSRVGSGGLTGRFGSGQDAFKSHGLVQVG